MAPRHDRRTGVWLFVAFSFAASAMFVAWRFIGPSDGAPVSFYSGAWSSEGMRVDPGTVDTGPRQSIRAGDLVIAIDGRPVNDWLADAFNPLAAHPAAAETTVHYKIERDGAPLDVPVLLMPRDLSVALIDNWGNILFGAVLLAVAVYVLFKRADLQESVALAVAATGAGASVTPWFLGLSISDVYFGWPFLLQALTVNLIYMVTWPAAVHLPLAGLQRTSGRQLSRRMLAAVYGVPLCGYAALLLVALVASHTLTAWMATWPALQSLVIIPSIVSGLVIALASYRRSTTMVRRQIRWAVIGITVSTVVAVTLLFGPQLLTGRPLIPWTFIGLVALPAPVGLAIGIVRHRLFDIEVVVNRTLVYGGVTLAIVVIYATTVLILGTVIPQGQGFPAQLLATGLAAIAALPVRDRLQRTVNRLMYGDRDEPYRALARLSQRLESTIEPLAIPSAIVESVAEALRLPYVALEIGPSQAVELTASHGQPTAPTRQLPLVYGAESVGRLLLAQRTPTEQFSASDLRLLDDLARSAGAAVHSVRLTLDIVRARERTVAAREEERRRIRRDLHDGLGPSLAAIGMRVEVAAELAASDPPAAQETLNQLNTEVRAAIGEIRRLVEGLRPPSLDERGLIGAIQAQADRLGPQPTFTVSAQHELPELPAAVEVAAYRIAVEAMTNAARHAHAHDCSVLIRLTDDGRRELRLEVSDDGAGLPADARPGIGLTSMRERAAEVGGTLEILRGTAGGTTITARLPIGATAL